MSGVTPSDGTAEPVSRDHIVRRERVRGNIIFPVQLTSTNRIGNQARFLNKNLNVSKPV